jgi:hypothetical protein
MSSLLYLDTSAWILVHRISDGGLDIISELKEDGNLVLLAMVLVELGRYEDIRTSTIDIDFVLDNFDKRVRVNKNVLELFSLLRNSFSVNFSERDIYHLALAYMGRAGENEITKFLTSDRRLYNAHQQFSSKVLGIAQKLGREGPLEMVFIS